MVCTGGLAKCQLPKRTREAITTMMTVCIGTVIFVVLHDLLLRSTTGRCPIARPLALCFLPQPLVSYADRGKKDALTTRKTIVKALPPASCHYVVSALRTWQHFVCSLVCLLVCSFALSRCISEQSKTNHSLLLLSSSLLLSFSLF